MRGVFQIVCIVPCVHVKRKHGVLNMQLDFTCSYAVMGLSPCMLSSPRCHQCFCSLLTVAAIISVSKLREAAPKTRARRVIVQDTLASPTVSAPLSARISC